jgi:hypothetical protein
LKTTERRKARSGSVKERPHRARKGVAVEDIGITDETGAERGIYI